jgi:hypothetical protein
VLRVWPDGIILQSLTLVFVLIQGVPRELTKIIGLLHRPGSFPGPFILREKFTDT